MKIKKITLILLLATIMTACSTKNNEEIINSNENGEGGHKPIIYVDGSLYHLNPKKPGTTENLPDNFEYYGDVLSSMESPLDLPSVDLYGTSSMINAIGYKVYLSDDKNWVYIYYEHLEGYLPFELIQEENSSS